MSRILLLCIIICIFLDIVPTSPDIAMAIETPDQSHVGIETDKYSTLTTRKHALTDPALNESKRPSYDNDANSSGIIRKRKSDSNLENESQSKKLCKFTAKCQYQFVQRTCYVCISTKIKMDNPIINIYYAFIRCYSSRACFT